MAQWETELTELVTRRSGALVGYAYSLTRDKPQAEDLVQDALVKVYSRLRRPPSAGGQTQVDLDRPEATNAEGYVRRAILTIYLDGYRRRNHWSGLKHLLADDASSPGADRVATARVDVRTALRQLTPRQREAVLMRFFDDLTVPQIATALGTSQGTIKRHLFDATAVLRRALAEVSVPAVETDLDERLDTVAGAVRRRRTAKVGAVAGVSMVLAVALAWGAFAVKPWIRSEPVPPATPSPDVAAVGGAWVPSGWRDLGMHYYCGMEVTDLVSSSDTLRLELTGDVEVVAGGVAAPVRITRTDAEGPRLRGGSPMLVFAQDGRVVDLGKGWSGESGYRPPDAGESADGAAGAKSNTACGRWTTRGVASPSETYLDGRPAGTYDVYAVMWWDGLSDTNELAVSEPVTMEVPAVGTPDWEPLSIDIRDGYQPPWLEGTGLACGAFASEIPGGPRIRSERSGLRLEAETRGDGGDTAVGVTFTFTDTEGDAVDLTRTPISQIWLKDGRVVGVGNDVWSHPAERLQVDAGGKVSATMPLEPDGTCLEDPDAGLPSGNYVLYVLTELDPGSGGERQFMSVEVSSTYVIGG